MPVTPVALVLTLDLLEMVGVGAAPETVSEAGSHRSEALASVGDAMIGPPQEQGFPVKPARGLGDPGPVLLGLLWQYTQVSATLLGPVLDGPHLVRQMGLPLPEPQSLAFPLA
jgi:hypothetical protein